MVEDGRSVSEVSRALGIGENLPYRWRKREQVKQEKKLS